MYSMLKVCMDAKRGSCESGDKHVYFPGVPSVLVKGRPPTPSTTMEKEDIKKVRLRSLKDEIAARQGDECVESFDATVPKRHKTMSNRRNEQERSMRRTQNMVRTRKKEEAMAKASEPQKNKKKTNTRSNMIDSVVPVEIEHEKVVKKLTGKKELHIYMKNYHEFILNQAHALGEASYADRMEDEEREKEKKKAQEAQIFKKHVASLTPSLVLLASVVPHTTNGLSSKTVPSSSGRSINSYFRGRSGRNVNRTEREWRKIYHEKVKNATYIVSDWPNTAHDNSSDVISANKAKGAKDMKCIECNTHFFVDMKHGHLTCPKCGATARGGEGVGYQVTFSHQQATQKGAAPYDRLAHVSIGCVLGVISIRWSFWWFVPYI